MKVLLRIMFFWSAEKIGYDTCTYKVHITRIMRKVRLVNHMMNFTWSGDHVDWVEQSALPKHYLYLLYVFYESRQAVSVAVFERSCLKKSWSVSAFSLNILCAHSRFRTSTSAAAGLIRHNTQVSVVPRRVLAREGAPVQRDVITDDVMQVREATTSLSHLLLLRSLRRNDYVHFWTLESVPNRR